MNGLRFAKARFVRTGETVAGDSIRPICKMAQTGRRELPVDGSPRHLHRLLLLPPHALLSNYTAPFLQIYQAGSLLRTLHLLFPLPYSYLHRACFLTSPISLPQGSAKNCPFQRGHLLASPVPPSLFVLLCSLSH